MDHEEWLRAIAPKLEEICEEWNKAEAEVKLAEQVSDAIVLPSINELRYAGRRLIDALVAISADTEPKKFQDFLADARFNCHRARHDALDSATAKIASNVENMLKHLGYNVVTQCFPQLSELRHSLRTTRERIVVSREDRENRDAIYQTISQTDFPNLVRLHSLLMEDEAPMREMAAAARRKEFRNNLLGVGGAIIGAFGVAVAILAWKFPHLLGGG